MGSPEFPPTDRCPCGSGKTFIECCQPKGVDNAALHASTVEAMRESGVDDALIYAYERTHLIVSTHHRETLSAADLDEWDDAVAEYRETHPSDRLN
jgi:uncharacterized protein YchJ